jgi:hypothetical protein
MAFFPDPVVLFDAKASVSGLVRQYGDAYRFFTSPRLRGEVGDGRDSGVSG